MNITATKTHAHLAWHGHSHITVDTTSGYVQLDADTLATSFFDALATSCVKTGALKVGDLIEFRAWRDAERGTYRRLYRRITSITPVNGGAYIGFMNEDGSAETNDLFPLQKYGWGKSWDLVTEKVTA